jgi:hypothetical protein
VTAADVVEDDSIIVTPLNAKTVSNRVINHLGVSSCAQELACDESTSRDLNGRTSLRASCKRPFHVV